MLLLRVPAAGRIPVVMFCKRWFIITHQGGTTKMIGLTFTLVSVLRIDDAPITSLVRARRAKT